MAQVNNFIKQLPHVAQEPLRIEREFEDGREFVVIDGVRYEADYFRTFAHPETDVLYAVQTVDDGCVKLTVIDTREKALEFFDEVENA